MANALNINGLVGVGVQGDSDFQDLDRVADAYLVLESDIGFCHGLGSRAWLRVLNNGTEWRDPEHWAQKCTDKMAEVYPYGTRVLIPANEQNLGYEGGGETEADYIFLGQWWTLFLLKLRKNLADRGMSDVLIAGPGLSPGHQETDGGRYYKHLKYCLSNVDIILVHYYWHPGGGFLNDPDAIHWSKRIEQDMAYLKQLGVPDKPWCIGEFNREVEVNDESDRNNAVEQIKQYFDYKPEITKFYFLATNVDPNFNKLSLSKMAGSIDRLAEWKANRPKPQQPEVQPVATLQEQYPDAFAAWRDAGGVTDNFLEFLIGIGAITPTKAQTLTVLGNARASLAAAEKAVNALPF